MEETKELDKKIAELAKTLTKLQRKVVINVVNGMSQRQAYLAAGGQAKRSKTQDTAVNTMLSNVKVKAYYDALLEKAQNESILKKQEALNILSDQARTGSQDPAVVRNVQTAIKQLSSMLGWDSPAKKEITGKDGGAIATRLDKSYTDEELLAIINDE